MENELECFNCKNWVVSKKVYFDIINFFDILCIFESSDGTIVDCFLQKG